MFFIKHNFQYPYFRSTGRTPSYRKRVFKLEYEKSQGGRLGLMCNFTGVLKCVVFSSSWGVFGGETSEQLSFNLVSLFHDTTGLKFMSLVSNLNEKSTEILKLNRIRQRYFQTLVFTFLRQIKHPAMGNWWGGPWRFGIQHLNISSFDPFLEPDEF